MKKVFVFFTLCLLAFQTTKSQNAFDGNWFNFLPENIEVTRHFSGGIGYFVPYDIDANFIGNKHLKFPSYEIFLSYGYTFNNRLSVGLGFGIVDFEYDRVEKNDDGRHYIPVRPTMMGIPIAIDIKYSITSWNVKPTIGVRGGLMANLVSELSTTEFVADGHLPGYIRTYEKRMDNPWIGFSLGLKKDRIGFFFEALFYGFTSHYEQEGLTEEQWLHQNYSDGDFTSYSNGMSYTIGFTFALVSKKIR